MDFLRRHLQLTPPKNLLPNFLSSGCPSFNLTMPRPNPHCVHPREPHTKKDLNESPIKGKKKYMAINKNKSLHLVNIRSIQIQYYIPLC